MATYEHKRSKVCNIIQKYRKEFCIFTLMFQNWEDNEKVLTGKFPTFWSYCKQNKTYYPHTHIFLFKGQWILDKTFHKGFTTLIKFCVSTNN